MGPRLLGRGRSFDEPGLHRRSAGRSHAGAAGWATARVVERVSRLPGLPVRAASTWTRARSLLACSALISAPPPPTTVCPHVFLPCMTRQQCISQLGSCGGNKQHPLPPPKKENLGGLHTTTKANFLLTITCLSSCKEGHLRSPPLHSRAKVQPLCRAEHLVTEGKADRDTPYDIP